MQKVDYWNFNKFYNHLPIVGEVVRNFDTYYKGCDYKVVSIEEHERGDYKVWHIELDGCFLCGPECAHNEIIYFTEKPHLDKMGAIAPWEKRCSYHDGIYDGSRRYDESNANDLYPVGYETRWINDYSNNKHILACSCGKGYFPGEADEK